MKVARIYLRVSTDGQDLTRQAEIETTARAAGFYIAGVYREKASGARADRPELLRMIADLQPGDVVVAESIDRISRLPLPEAEKLVASIRATGARLSVPGVVDLTDLAATAEGVAKVVLESVQDMLLKLALQMFDNCGFEDLPRSSRLPRKQFPGVDNLVLPHNAEHTRMGCKVEHRHGCVHCQACVHCLKAPRQSMGLHSNHSRGQPRTGQD